jgi:hypothetical protein
MATVHRMYIPEHINIPSNTYSIEQLIAILSDQNIELKYLDKIRDAYYILAPFDVIQINNYFLFLNSNKALIYNQANYIPSSIMFGLTDQEVNNDGFVGDIRDLDGFVHYLELIERDNLNFQIYDLLFNSNYCLINIPDGSNSLPIINLSVFYCFCDSNTNNTYDEEDFIQTRNIQILQQIYSNSKVNFSKLRYGTILKLDADYASTYMYTGSQVLQKVGNYCCICLPKDTLEITGLAKYTNIIRYCSGITFELPNGKHAKIYFEGDLCKVKL